MFKIKYILQEGDSAHYKYFTALDLETAQVMFFSQYEDSGYSPQILEITQVSSKRDSKVSPA